MLWTVVLTLPFMVAIQLISARIGRVTGEGIISNVKATFPRPVVLALVALLVAANVINIAADLAAMGDALKLVIGGGQHGYALIFGVLCMSLEIFIPYRRYSPILKWLTLVLFAYVATVLSIDVPWGEAVHQTIFPTLSLSPEYLLVVVGVFGTTISPYLFFWQASQEVEDMRNGHKHRPLKDIKHKGGDPVLRRIAIDTVMGMTFSNLIAYFIIVTTAVTLHTHGITDIQTSAQAAEALRPLAGQATFLLFALGIVGTGLLAVPVLAGSAAYGLGEALNLRTGLDAAPSQAKGFYTIIGVATLAGVVADFSSLDPIKMLFWSAVINGVVAVPIMAVMIVIASHSERMGIYAIPLSIQTAGWAATAIMAIAVVAMGWTLIP